MKQENRQLWHDIERLFSQAEFQSNFWIWCLINGFLIIECSCIWRHFQVHKLAQSWYSSRPVFSFGIVLLVLLFHIVLLLFGENYFHEMMVKVINFFMRWLQQVDAALDLSHTQNIGRMIKAHFPHSQVWWFFVISSRLPENFSFWNHRLHQKNINIF